MSEQFRQAAKKAAQSVVGIAAQDNMICPHAETIEHLFYRVIEEQVNLAVAGACNNLLDALFDGQEELANGWEEPMSQDPDDCEFRAENCFGRKEAESRIPASAREALERHDALVAARAKRDESKWWKAGHICDNSRDCQACKRDAAHEAEVKRLEEQP